ncbi:hypothetical protein CHS0354_025649 [Potamilus streckersoni]|uniref:Cystatin domain-containing protein n=1 Tax=Potamilus streckersoni TaxID=2493646 RepID=A0AAE0VKW1_9BIVA|nr:hypothetical protein CHS0354_025649 [Potamilus streckersoni]
MARMCGGIGEEMKPTEKVHSMIAEFREEIEQKTGKNFAEFEALKFASQLVAGTNYFIKIKVGPSECIHVRLYEALPHTHEPVKLNAILEGRKIEDAIDYF